MSIRIFTDGSFDSKTNRYAWAFVVVDGIRTTNYAFGVGDDVQAVDMRNVAAELSAAMHAVKWAKDNGITMFTLVHDYEGVGKWMTPKDRGGWEAKRPMVQEYVKYMHKIMGYGIRINFQWIKGHSGNQKNEFADDLAGKAIEKCAERGVTAVYEKYNN